MSNTNTLRRALRTALYALAIAPFLSLQTATAQPKLPIDYSYCGYKQSEEPIPDAKNVVVVSPVDGDNSDRLQQAIDYVSGLKRDPVTGLRGAVLLTEGTFAIEQPLKIAASGVVVRGSGSQKTILSKTGTARGAVVYIEGVDNRRITATHQLSDSYVPAGATTLSHGFAAGEEVLICRPSTKEWIAHLGCDTWGGGSKLGYWAWHEGEEDVVWDRTILSDLSLNAPVTCALDSKWGTATIQAYEWKGRIEQSGVENLAIVSTYDSSRPQDEDHAWNGVYIAAARDCWVRQVRFEHLAGSAVVVQRNGSRITIEDCVALKPVSEIGGMRRRVFYTLGTQTLFQRCYSEYGVNDFSAGQCAAGPNAFVQCDSWLSNGPSGSIGPWATGLLFDVVNIDGDDLRYSNLKLEKYGAGWNTANSVMWQCTAAGIDCYSPDSDAVCMAVGCWADFQGNGIVTDANNHVKPYSIYSQLLRKRLEAKAKADGNNGLTEAQQKVIDALRVIPQNTGESTSPTIEEAQHFAALSHQPRLTMQAWISQAPQTFSTDPLGVPTLEQATKGKTAKKDKADRQRQQQYLVDGVIVDAEGALFTGRTQGSPWWNGRLRYSAAPKAQIALTRFVPTAEGHGYTDRIDTVIARMSQMGATIFSQNPPLWYDRRRDDHERIRRKDGDTWGPFYEHPYSRSGLGSAWDGLSRYDLTRPNPFYFSRLNEFAEKGAEKGMLLINCMYMQHSILEAGAHYADYPWRTANNINHEELPEPVPYAGDKRIFLAQQFYDTSNEKLSQLHRTYIRNTLDQLANQPNVIHSLGSEFTGPLHFVQFWLDCVAEWEKDHGKKVLVMLSATKDVQDSILHDPIRSKTVDIIAIEQWYRHLAGDYAPNGGLSMAPRQYSRKMKGGRTTFQTVLSAVKEYRTSYPDKAVIYYGPAYPENSWAIIMGGGSCPAMNIKSTALKQAVAKMTPADDVNGVTVMQGKDGMLLYSDSGEKQTVPVAASKATVYEVRGRAADVVKTGKAKGEVTIGSHQILWVAYE